MTCPRYGHLPPEAKTSLNDRWRSKTIATNRYKVQSNPIPWYKYTTEKITPLPYCSSFPNEIPTKSQQNRNKIATNSHEKTHEKIANNLRRWLIFSGDAFIISGAPSPATPEMKPIHSTLPSTCTSASKTVLSRMQLTLHATRPWLGESNVCLVGENPT